MRNVALTNTIHMVFQLIILDRPQCTIFFLIRPNKLECKNISSLFFTGSIGRTSDAMHRQNT